MMKINLPYKAEMSIVVDSETDEIVEAILYTGSLALEEGEDAWNEDLDGAEPTKKAITKAVELIRQAKRTGDFKNRIAIKVTY
jgi:hypothetical protein